MEAEQEFVDVAFEILDKNAIVEIMKKMKPYEVLSLCETQTQMARICGDQDVFRALMKAHYPQFPIDEEDPKRQYEVITANYGIEYYVKIFEEEGEKYYDNKVYQLEFLPADVDYEKEPNLDYVAFTILGTTIRTGDTLWLQIIEEDYSANAYSSADDAMAESVTLYFEAIDPILEDLNYSPFVEWLGPELYKKRGIGFNRVDIVRAEELVVYVYEGQQRYDATEEFLQWGYDADVPVTRRSALRKLESQGYLDTDLHGGDDEEAYKIVVVKVRVYRSENGQEE